MSDRVGEAPTLWLVGYGRWPVANRAVRLVEALTGRGVTRLVDVRLNPCASDVRPGRYGPKPWNLQAGGQGIAGLLASSGIGYEWMVELGNPQRHDPGKSVLLEHLADRDGGWPVHRGLARLAGLVRRPGEVIALLCACADDRACHRTVIARALAELAFDGHLSIKDASSGRSV